MKLNNFIFVINIFFLLIQLIFSKPTKVFYILWILFFLIYSFFHIDCSSVINITYFLNSVTVIHKIFSKNKYII